MSILGVEVHREERCTERQRGSGRQEETPREGKGDGVVAGQIIFQMTAVGQSGVMSRFHAHNTFAGHSTTFRERIRQTGLKARV